MLSVSHDDTSATYERQPFADDNGWGGLAIELRVRILAVLDATDLLSCSKVNRALRTLVDGTPSLRYRLVLHAAGMEDGPPGGSSVTKRLAKLEEYESTWKVVNMPVRQEVGRPTGGFFVKFDQDRSLLNVRRPASFFNGVTEKTWTVDVSGLDAKGGPDLELVSSYDVDVAQDLLVITVLPEDPEEYPECYVLSLSQNGVTHPLATRRRLSGGSSLGLSSSHGDLEIVGDLIGWTVLGMDICMNVYNWKTGVSIWCDSEYDEHEFMMGTTEYHTRCHILDPSYILKVSKYTLAVYRATAGIDGKLVCTLGMPRLAEGFEAMYCSSYIQRPPQTPDCSPYFQCDPSLAVLVLEYDISPKSSRARTSGDRAMLLVIVPISTILNQARRTELTHSPEVPWEDWGALGARLVLVPYKTRCTSDIQVFGSRVAVAVAVAGSSGMMEVALLDVRESAKLGTDPTADGAGTSLFLILNKFTKAETPIFNGPVEAKMPYRIVRTQHSDVPPWKMGCLSSLSL